MGSETRRKGRGLGPEERRLWERVAATARPLHAPAGRSHLPAPSEQELRGTTAPAAKTMTAGIPEFDTSAPDSLTASSRARPSGSRPGSHSLRLAPPEASVVGRPEPGLDRRTAERLRKGARAPDARIDLHGMTAERAHRACLSFLGEALGRGHRVVLVITGKGRRRETGWRDDQGVLRASLPGWLRASPFGHSILGVYQAHRRHGGEGAFYVYLKRRR